MERIQKKRKEEKKSKESNDLKEKLHTQIERSPSKNILIQIYKKCVNWKSNWGIFRSLD